MNELYAQEFIKQATKNGVPREKVASIMQRASQIANRQIKTASKLDIVDGLIAEAGLQKNASSVSYVHGILNEAIVKGANVPQAIQFTKQALDETTKKLAFMEKVSAIANNPKLNYYAEGFIGHAKQAGLSQDEAVRLLVDVVDKEKRANGGDPGAMFKHPSDEVPPAPEGDPAAGAPPGGDPSGGMGAPGAGDPSGGMGMPGPGDPSGGQGGPGASDPQEAQILQMLQSLPPEEQQQIIQQLLAAISGGQAGPGGAPPGAGGPQGPPMGGPPMGGPPPGPQGPPMGGPQGPA